MGDSSFQNNVPDPLLSGKELPSFKFELEMPFSTRDSFITPTESFYVRTHFPIPAVDRDEWWLRLEGEVEKPFAINYEQLLKLKSVTIPVTLECAGNSRNFLEPKVKGVQWRLGAVGTAEWTGVPLSILLDRAGVKPNACEVILEGADGGILEDPKSPPGKLHFVRSIPMEKARADVLLAYKMNGRELPPQSGAKAFALDNPPGSTLRSQRSAERRLSRRSFSQGGPLSGCHNCAASYSGKYKNEQNTTKHISYYGNSPSGEHWRG